MISLLFSQSSIEGLYAYTMDFSEVSTGLVEYATDESFRLGISSTNSDKLQAKVSSIMLFSRCFTLEMI